MYVRLNQSIAKLIQRVLKMSITITIEYRLAKKI